MAAKKPGFELRRRCVMTTLSLLVLRALDPDRLARFYGAFGLSFRAEQHGSGPLHHACDLNGFVLEIYPASSSSPRTSGARLGFRVASINEALRACGSEARIVTAPHESEWGYRAVVQDPEGHTIELTETR